MVAAIDWALSRKLCAIAKAHPDPSVAHVYFEMADEVRNGGQPLGPPTPDFGRARRLAEETRAARPRPADPGEAERVARARRAGLASAAARRGRS